MGGCIVLTKIGAKGSKLLELYFLVGFHIYAFYMYLSLMKNFLNTFLENYVSQKPETWYKHGQWVDVSCLPK